MSDAGKLRTRAATIADAAAIADIYNQGIADRIATFETEPRAAADIAAWFAPRHLVVVAETGEEAHDGNLLRRCTVMGSVRRWNAAFPENAPCKGMRPPRAGIRNPSR
jgi:hypothetical protein